MNTRKFAMLYTDPRHAPPPIPIVPGAELDEVTDEWLVVGKDGSKFTVVKDDDGTPYFINKATKKSQWEDPREENDSPSCSDAADDSGSCTNPDDGVAAKVESITTSSGEVWYVYYSETDKEQVPYYLNAKTRTTQWEDPRSFLVQAKKKVPPQKTASDSDEDEDSDEYE